LNGKGELEWANNLDRNVQYDGGYSVRFINDVNVVAENGSFYVIYGNTDKDKTKSKAQRKKEKKVKDKIRPFEYAVFNEKTGEVKRKTFAVNKISTPKKERVNISAARITVIGNRFYTQDTKTKRTAMACLMPCGAGWLWGNINKGYGRIGEIEVIEK